MKKIPTLFERDETQKGRPVIDKVKAGCEWVLAGEGTPTRKLDGTNVKIEAGMLYKRQKPKEGDYDEASYVLASRDDPGDKYLWEAFDNRSAGDWRDGIYGAIGPKIQGNPEGLSSHRLVPVCPHSLTLELMLPTSLTFTSIRDWLAGHPYEGIVWHHPDGRMAKIKRRDYGLKWPVAQLKLPETILY